MSHRIELSLRAQQDLDEIMHWLSEPSPAGAATWLHRFNEILTTLTDDPQSWSLAPENDDHDEEIHHVVFKTRRGRKYRALFIVRDDVIFVTNLRGPGQDFLPPSEIGD